MRLAYYTCEETKIIETIKKSLLAQKDFKFIQSDLLKTTSDRKSIGKFTSFLGKWIQEYGISWLNWITDNDKTKNTMRMATHRSLKSYQKQN